MDDERVAAALGPVAKLSCRRGDRPAPEAAPRDDVDPLAEPLAAAGADAEVVAAEPLLAAAHAPIAMIAAAPGVASASGYGDVPQVQDRGLVVVGFPSNDFGNREPAPMRRSASFAA